MEVDPFVLVLAGAVFIIYCASCFISGIFTFSLDIYRKIEDRLKLELFPSRVLNPLEKNVDWLNDWLMENNKIAGPALILFSLVDIKLSFDIFCKL